MQNYVQRGQNLTFTATAAVVSGQALLMGSVFGVASGAAAIGAPFTLVVNGVFDLPRAAALTVAEGAKLYWDNTAKNVTNVLTANTLIGACHVASVSADTTIQVYLDGAVR